MHSLARLFVALSQLLNLHTCTRSRHPNYKVSAPKHSSLFTLGERDLRHSFKDLGSILMVQIMKQTGSTKTNFEKADASAEITKGEPGSTGDKPEHCTYQ